MSQIHGNMNRVPLDAAGLWRISTTPDITILVQYVPTPDCYQIHWRQKRQNHKAQAVILRDGDLVKIQNQNYGIDLEFAVIDNHLHWKNSGED